MKKFIYLTLCIIFASCQTPKQTVFEQSVAVAGSINQTFVYENDNDQVPHNVYLTITHGNQIDFTQLVVTFSHSRNDVQSFIPVSIGIPLFDAKGNFLATKTDSLWKYEIPILSNTYFTKEAQSFTFTSDEGRVFNGLKTIGIRIEK
ncbi:MAG: hypothetical protein FWC39_06560 [Bacteroidetes bacterium]|nr:hypothetical protein [Bacteroidota bacterium]MCL2328162.1 hypothetical protein [Bacteroidota bacterium]